MLPAACSAPSRAGGRKTTVELLLRRVFDCLTCSSGVGLNSSQSTLCTRMPVSKQVALLRETRCPALWFSPEFGGTLRLYSRAASGSPVGILDHAGALTRMRLPPTPDGYGKAGSCIRLEKCVADQSSGPDWSALHHQAKRTALHLQLPYICRHSHPLMVSAQWM
jgi:hypothetical protein